MKRRGVSEIVSATILIAIILAGIVLYTYLFSSSRSASMKTFRDIMSERKESAKELLSIIHANYRSGVISIYIFNYGFRDVRIDRIYVGSVEAISYTITDLYTNSVVSSISRDDFVRVDIPMSLSGEVPVIIFTDSGNTYSVMVSG
jgi:flagellin-like protein